MSLETDVLQFGFKKNSSTVICNSMLKETIDYYNENKTHCYLLLLDASKAFDRVEYSQLSMDCVTRICVQLYYDY